MNTIGQTKGVQPAGPGVQIREQSTRPENPAQRISAVPEEGAVRDDLNESEVRVPVPEPDTGTKYLDPEQMREFMARVSDAIREASSEPHLVGFKPDPDSTGYLIEIRKADGTLVTTFAPEKVLNLHGNPDDLAGMVIDRKT